MKVFGFAFLIFVAVTYAQWTAYVPTTDTSGCDIFTTDNFDVISLATDSKGRAWQMSGRINSCSGSPLPSFLRYFDRNTHNWTIAWQEGDSTGPSSRDDAVMWIDKDDNVYIFGGQGDVNVPRCDFWQFSPDSKTWTDLTVGDGTLNNVQKGVEDAANYPGCRRGSGYWYTPDDNSLWLFSGYDNVYDDALHPDLWRFNITSQKWAFIAGLIDPITSDDPVFADPFEVTPYQRWGPHCAVDAQYNLWLYGGELSDDLWMFNRSSGWQYISGNKNYSSNFVCNQPASTIGEGVFSSAHRPVCSAFGSMTYIGNALAMYSSYIAPAGPAKTWLYDIPTQQWAYYTSPGEGAAIADVLYVPDNSTTPGYVRFTRTLAPRSLWVVADKSYGVYVLDFPQCDSRYNVCSQHATCQEDQSKLDPICTCNEGYEGNGFTCTVIPAPVSPPSAAPVTANTPATDNAPVGTNTPSNTPKGKSSSASLISTAGVTALLAGLLGL